jgi:uncharacterized protein (TIGR02118 family)
MIKVSVLYPNTEGAKFDMEYYLNKHIPMVQQKLGAACKSIAVDLGLGSAEPGSRPPYVVMGHMYFDSPETFQAAIGPHMQANMGDIPNFTNTQPAIQISEVKM